MALTQVNSNGVKNDSIVDADIKSGAAIAFSKLATTPATLTGSTNNTITTVTAAHTIQGEANLTYDGTTLKNQVAAENGTITNFALSGQTNNPALLIKADESDQQITFRAGADTSTYPSIAFDMGTVGDAVTIHPNGQTTVGTSTPSGYDDRMFTAYKDGGCYIEIRTEAGDYNTGILFSKSYAQSSDSYRGYIAYNHNDNCMKFYVNGGTEEFRIQSGGGISFNGDTATANALDDYEEGTFTPSWGPAVGSFTSISYSSQDGYYVKVGRVVNVWFRLNVNAINTSGGSSWLKFSGLPFTATTGHGVDGGTLNVNYYTNAISNMGDQVPTGYVQNNNTTIVMGKNGGNEWANIAATDLGTVNFYAHMTYYSAS